jgi:hypothetical protein
VRSTYRMMNNARKIREDYYESRANYVLILEQDKRSEKTMVHTTSFKDQSILLVTYTNFVTNW